MLKSNFNRSDQVIAPTLLQIPRQSRKIRTRQVSPARWAPTAQHERGLGNSGYRISVAKLMQPLWKYSGDLRKRHLKPPFKLENAFFRYFLFSAYKPTNHYFPKHFSATAFPWHTQEPLSCKVFWSNYRESMCKLIHVKTENACWHHKFR